MHNPNTSILDIFCNGNIQKDPLSLRRIFLYLIRNHFADATNFGGVPDSFKNLTYSDNELKRNLHIELDFVYDENRLEQLPCIYVGFGDFKFQKSIIGNSLDSTPDNAGLEFTNSVVAPLVIKHVSLTPDEALMLSVLTTSFLRGIAIVLKSTLNLRSMEIDTLTAPKLINPSADKQFISVVSAQLAYQDNWTTYVESHRIKKVTFI